MYKLIILGSGAAPGVPSIAGGWGDCDSSNPKNSRTRTSTYLEYKNTKILIDTSPDLRQQLLQNQICHIDGVIYTHSHADHLHGIDDLREINRAEQGSLNFYATAATTEEILLRFPYLISQPGEKGNVSARPSMVANVIEYYQPFWIKELKITPIRLLGHNLPSTGYIFNDGDIVYIADYRRIDEVAYSHITQPIKLMVLPLTTPEGGSHHASLDEVLSDVKFLKPKQAVINHMAIECDYDVISRITPENVEPAFDNMTIIVD